MTQNASFADLRKKYEGFAAPTLRILVDGTDITKNRTTHVSEVSVQLSNESQATGCSFTVVGEYDPEKSAFRSEGSYTKLQIGAKVEVQLGYIKTETVFFGLIMEVSYVFDNASSAPAIQVECMDAICLLMKQQNMGLFTGKTAVDAVNELLSAQPFSSYIKGKKVENNTDREDMIPNAMEDDFTFISRYACELGYEFFIFQGIVYFRKPPSQTASSLTLSPDSGLRGARLSHRGSALFKKITVVGINPDTDEKVSGEAQLLGRISKGSTANRMMGNSEKTVFDQRAASTADAMAKAKTIMTRVRGTFGRLECECVGLPELVPGRAVRISGLSPDADKGVYLLKVNHSFNESGFSTSFEARVDPL